jgi:hypothetical protein
MRAVEGGGGGEVRKVDIINVSQPTLTGCFLSGGLEVSPGTWKSFMEVQKIPIFR